MDIVLIKPKSEPQCSVLNPRVDVEIKLEIDDTIKLEKVEEHLPDRPKEETENDSEEVSKDFEREVTELCIPNEIDEIKLEADELIIKQESEGSDNNVIHTEPEKIVCEACGKTLKNKITLRKHRLLHKDLSTVKLWKCSQCNYETKHKKCLKKHLLVHKDPSEMEMFRCDSCGYSCKRKYELKKHISRHNDAKALSMSASADGFECGICGLTLKSQRGLQQHQLLHRDRSIAKVWQCPECDYQTKDRKDFNDHVLTHRDLSEVQTFSCGLCSYKGRRKGDLWKHIWQGHKVAKDSSLSASTEPKKFECGTCGKTFKQKMGLEKHRLSHEDPSTIKFFSCSECKFRTRYRSNLYAHMLRHKHKSVRSATGLEKTQCGMAFKRRAYLEKHELGHKDPSTVDL